MDKGSLEVDSIMCRPEPKEIVVFSWVGKDRPGWGDPVLNKEYVHRFFRTFKKNTSIPFRFWCFTDNIMYNVLTMDAFPGIWIKPMSPPSWKGCLPKLYAFSPFCGFQGKHVFVFDLDTVITGSLDDLLSYDGDIATRKTFVKQDGEWKSGGDLVFFNRHRMGWRVWRFVSNGYKGGIEKWTGGRERFVYRELFKDELDFIQDLYPGQLVSYKRHVRPNNNRLPDDNVRIVSCHGNPRPHELAKEINKHEWLKEHWG